MAVLMTENYLRPLCLLLLVMTACFLPARATIGIETAEDVEYSRKVTQKVSLLKGLTRSSAFIDRMESQAVDEVKVMYEQAQDNLEKAVTALEANRLTEAEKYADEGLRMLTNAGRLYGKRKPSGREVQDRYLEKLNRVSSYQKALQFSDTELAREVDRMVAVAAISKQNGDLQQANQTLDQALRLAESSLVSAHANETLVYSLDFETKQEEWEYELKRNDNYRLLVGMVLKERPVSGSSAAYIKSMIESNSSLRERADTLAAQKEYDAAIEGIDQATAQLERILKLVGVPIP